MTWLRRYMNSTVLIRQRTGSDGYGAGTYGSGVEVAAMLKTGNKLVRNDKGDNVVSTMRVYVDKNTTVGDGAQISTDGGSTYLDYINKQVHRNLLGRTQMMELSL